MTLNPQSNRLSTQDASFIYGESIAGPLHIGSVSVFDGEIPFHELTAAVAAKLPLIPRYRQRLHFVPFNLAHATWEDDPYFDIRNHVKRHHVANGSTVERAVTFSIREHESILNRSRPLWELHSFEGVPGKTVLLSKVHHCLVDGVSGIDLASVLFDDSPEVPVTVPEDSWMPRPLPSLVDAVMDAMRDNFNLQAELANAFAEKVTDPALAAREAAQVANASRQLGESLLSPATTTPWNSGGLVTSRRSLAWSNLPLATLEAIRRVHGGTANDVMLAILAEAAARYLEGRGIAPSASLLRIGCPVSVRTADEAGTLGNRISMMFPATSPTPMAADARLKAMVAETGRIKRSREPQHLERLLRATEMIPATMLGMASLLSMTTVDAVSSMSAWAPAVSARPVFPLPSLGLNFIASSVPALERPQYLAGHEMLEMIGLIPLAGNLGFGVAITTYRDTLTFGLMAEPRMVPDLDRMKAHLDGVIAELHGPAA